MSSSITLLSRDEWLHIDSFLSPNDTSSLAQTCRYLDETLTYRRNLNLTGNAIFQRLIQDSDHYKKAGRKIGFLQNVLRRSFPISRALCENSISSRIDGLRNAFLSKDAPLAPFNPPENSDSPVERRMSQATRRLSNSGDELWIWGLLNDDQTLCSKLREELFPPSTLHAGAFISLLKKDQESFWNILRLSPALRNYDLIWPFLLHTAATNQLDLFEQLFRKCSQIQPNSLLVELVRGNYPLAVSRLLQLAQGQIDRQAYVDNGYNRPQGGTRGLHTALLTAFDLNHWEAAKILLETFPGQQIPLAVFQNIYTLFQLAPVAPGQILLPEDLMWQEHATRLQHPNINGVLERMNQEAAQRYPGQALQPLQIQQAQAPQDEAALPAQGVEEPIQQPPAQLGVHPSNRNSMEALFMSAAFVFAGAHVISPEEPGSTLFLTATLLIGLFLLDRLFTYY